MVCEKCREKLKAKGVVTGSIVPDKYKDGKEGAVAEKGGFQKVDRVTAKKNLNNPYAKGE